ncbi:MAG: SBBP repeat-containing protein [Thermoplasmatales archaeon]|nr:SBBP repeat-containing protein [Thermoplasmatales archaeon]
MISVCSISFHRNGDSDVFVTKLAPEGTSLMYSTYLGGNKFNFGHGITVGDNEYAYVTGYTQSTDVSNTQAFVEIIAEHVIHT